MQQQINQMLGVLTTGLGGIKHLKQQKAQTTATEKNTETTQALVDKVGEREINDFIGNVAELTGYEEGSKLELLLLKAADATTECYNTNQMIAARKDLIKQLRDAPPGVTKGIEGTVRGTIGGEKHGNK